MALIKLVLVGALVFGILHNVLAIHNKKQHAFARSLADRVVANSQGGVPPPKPSTTAFDDGSVSTVAITPTVAASTRDPIAPLVITSAPPAPSTALSSSSSTSSSSSSSPIRTLRGGAVFVPFGWADRQQSGSAQSNAHKDAQCAAGGDHEDDGGRTTNPIAPIYASPEGGECAAVEAIPGLCDALTALLPPPTPTPAGAGAGVSAAAAAAVAERAVLLGFGATPREAVHVVKTAADHTGARAVLVVAGDEATVAAAAAAGLPYIRPSSCGGGGGVPCRRPQFAAAAAVLALGADVLLVSHGVDLHGPNPLRNLPASRGADVEGVTAQQSNLGQVVGMHDPAMGWSAYSQSMAFPHLLSSLVLARATEEARRLAEWLGGGGANNGGDVDVDVDADVALSDEVLMPAHDGRQRAGATFRALPSTCFKAHGGGAAVADAATAFPGKPWHSRGGTSAQRWNVEDANEILTSETFDQARGTVLRDGPIGDADANGNCAAIAPRERVGPAPRPLRYVAPPGGEWPVGCDGDSDDLSSLCDVVRRVAVNRQVLAAVSNSNILYMLGLFLDGVAAANITNTVVVALDQRTADWCKKRGAPYYHRELKSLTGSTDNHATSGLKFQVLREFLTVGASVLLSDVDVVWMRNPFGGSRLVVPPVPSDPGRIHVDQPAIYGDADVEGMTDGWDDVSAYGFEHSGPGGAPMRRLAARNSGLFYLAGTREALRMVTRLAARMQTERSTWDQTAYNEEQVWMWSSDRGGGPNAGPATAGVSQRVMNYACFQNTKYLFRYMRYDKQLYDGGAGRSLRPVSVHVNYHPEKPQRMVTIMAQYIKGERDAISKWHWGEGMTFAKPCMARPRDRSQGDVLIGQSRLAQRVVHRVNEMDKNGVQHGTWAGVQGFKPRPDGTLQTPWGEGKWGVVPPGESEGKDRLFVDFSSAKHMVEAAEDVGAAGELHLTSTRCNDGEKVTILL